MKVYGHSAKKLWIQKSYSVIDRNKIIHNLDFTFPNDLDLICI
jgi:hypothetical protein